MQRFFLLFLAVSALAETVGNTDPSGSADSYDSGNANAFVVTAPVDGLISSIAVYVGAAADGAQFQVAIYEDAGGQPTHMLAVSPIRPIQPNSWNTATVSMSIVAGRQYWLTYNASGADPMLNNLVLTSGAGQYYWKAASFGQWPATYGTPDGHANATAAIYATYAPVQDPQAPVVMGTLNGHEILGDPTQHYGLLSWLFPQSSAFYLTAQMAADFMVNRVPIEPSQGLPAYYSQSFLVPGDPPSLSQYVYNPAGLLSMLIDSGISWAQFSGDPRLQLAAQNLADFQLANGLTPSFAIWPSVPYASSTASAIPYDGYERGTFGVVEPDKIGEVGYQLARLYEVTGRRAYLDAAVQDANVLAANIRSGDAAHSPWPFRVIALSGQVIDPYCADVIRPIQLFDELTALNAGAPDVYREARNQAWAWLTTYPMQNGLWSNYFEDMDGDITNLNQYVPLETARYLLLNPASDSNAIDDAKALISFVEANLAVPYLGANTVAEQKAFFLRLGSHTARYGSVLALLASMTGDGNAKEKALRSLNWATYMLGSNEQVIAGPDDPNEIWFSDGYGDYIRHFVSAMQTFPEWGIPPVGVSGNGSVVLHRSSRPE